jgi:phosphoribosylformylglycinamidine (FGAM) synthase PurS component
VACVPAGCGKTHPVKPGVTVTRYVEVVLTIPDNEAETALTTLRRLGVHVDELRRSDLYRIEVEPEREGTLLETLREIETIYNPNKHALRLRSDVAPQPGEAWIDEPKTADSARGPVHVAGRVLPGVWALERLVAWQLSDSFGKPASAEVVARATETLLCNPAFQRVTTNSHIGPK